MKILSILIVPFLASAALAYAAEPAPKASPQEIERLVQRLSWDSITVFHSVVTEADREKARAYWCGKVPEEYRRNCG